MFAWVEKHKATDQSYFFEYVWGKVSEFRLWIQRAILDVWGPPKSIQKRFRLLVTSPMDESVVQLFLFFTQIVRLIVRIYARTGLSNLLLMEGQSFKCPPESINISSGILHLSFMLLIVGTRYLIMSCLLDSSLNIVYHIILFTFCQDYVVIKNRIRCQQ